MASFLTYLAVGILSLLVGWIVGLRDSLHEVESMARMVKDLAEQLRDRDAEIDDARAALSRLGERFPSWEGEP